LITGVLVRYVCNMLLPPTINAFNLLFGCPYSILMR